MRDSKELLKTVPSCYTKASGPGVLSQLSCRDQDTKRRARSLAKARRGSGGVADGCPHVLCCAWLIVVSALVIGKWGNSVHPLLQPYFVVSFYVRATLAGHV